MYAYFVKPQQTYWIGRNRASWSTRPSFTTATRSARHTSTAVGSSHLLKTKISPVLTLNYVETDRTASGRWRWTRSTGSTRSGPGWRCTPWTRSPASGTASRSAGPRALWRPPSRYSAGLVAWTSSCSLKSKLYNCSFVLKAFHCFTWFFMFHLLY